MKHQEKKDTDPRGSIRRNRRPARVTNPESYAVAPSGQVLPADQYDPRAHHILVHPPEAA